MRGHGDLRQSSGDVSPLLVDFYSNLVENRNFGKINLVENRNFGKINLVGGG